MSLLPTDDATVGILSLLFGSNLNIDISKSNDPALGIFYIFQKYRDQAKSKVITRSWVEGLIRFMLKEALKAAPVLEQTRAERTKAEFAYRTCIYRALNQYRNEPHTALQAAAALCVLLAAPGEDTEEALRGWDKAMMVTDPDYKRSAMMEEIIKRAAHRTN